MFSFLLTWGYVLFIYAQEYYGLIYNYLHNDVM